MSLETFIRAMPKIELHVHLEGAILPSTLLTLARRHSVALPASDEAGLRRWYTFIDFPHFIETYILVSSCLRTPDDIELIAREFLAGQAAQHIVHSEVTYTAYTHFAARGLRFDDQLAALNRARAWGERELGVTMGLIIDISRETSVEAGMMVADWAIGAHGDGVIALGLGGDEVGNPPEKHAAAFDRARAAGMPLVLHAGETAGPESIWGALGQGAVRIGHGVRALEDPALVAELRDRQIPLEVSPSSNICLGVFPSLAAHSLPQLMAAGLYTTLNSDDPPMFDTTLTDEYLRGAAAYGWGFDELVAFNRRAGRAALLPAEARAALDARIADETDLLRAAHSV